MKTHVLISGAGPVGLVSALKLSLAGFKVTVFESADQLNMDLRASTFHPPTLDMMATFGLTDQLISQGLIARYTQQRDRKEGVVAEFDMELLKGETNFPFRLQCEQWKLTQLIKKQLDKNPDVKILFNAKLESVTQSHTEVEAKVKVLDETQLFKGEYLIGADGAWSSVRTSLGIEFEGFTYPERFLVISTTFPYEKHLPKLSFVNYCSDPIEWCVLLKVPSLWRVLFPTKVDESDEDVLSDSSVQSRLQHLLPQPNDYQADHRTLYKIHQRVAKSFRQNRIFLAGDAAHINNPLGGMGMNGGVHDAMNLCEKLIDVVIHRQDSSVLDRYERQRRSIAIEYINANTARNKKMLEESDPAVRLKSQQELRAIAENPKSAKAYLFKTSMLDALKKAEAIL
ncbi:MAG: NAD(P)/FAD-dependent oxidoreductase [Betaproteobacteria bacterium]